MTDLKLYTELVYQEPMELSSVRGTKTTRLETIANKVVKYILTDRGSDMVDPLYGVPPLTMNYNDMMRITYDTGNIISSCISYIKEAEKLLPTTTERLDTINLLSIDVVDRRQLKIRISILTTFKNYALLDFKK